jgi:hypothetical protein
MVESKPRSEDASFPDEAVRRSFTILLAMPMCMHKLFDIPDNVSYNYIYFYFISK